MGEKEIEGGGKGGGVLLFMYLKVGMVLSSVFKKDFVAAWL